MIARRLRGMALRSRVGSVLQFIARAAVLPLAYNLITGRPGRWAHGAAVGPLTCRGE